MRAQKSGAAPTGRPTAIAATPATNLPSIIHEQGGIVNVAASAAQSYPAVIVISRPATRVKPEPKVIIDNRILFDAVDLQERMQMFNTVENAYHTVGLYTYTAVPADEAVDVADEIRRELYQAEWGDSREDQETKFAAQRGVA